MLASAGPSFSLFRKLGGHAPVKACIQLMLDIIDLVGNSCVTRKYAWHWAILLVEQVALCHTRTSNLIKSKTKGPPPSNISSNNGWKTGQIRPVSARYMPVTGRVLLSRGICTFSEWRAGGHCLPQRSIYEGPNV